VALHLVTFIPRPADFSVKKIDIALPDMLVSAA